MIRGADIGKAEGILHRGYKQNNDAIYRHTGQPAHTHTINELKKMKQQLIDTKLEELISENFIDKVPFIYYVPFFCKYFPPLNSFPHLLVVSAFTTKK